MEKLAYLNVEAPATFPTASWNNLMHRFGWDDEMGKGLRPDVWDFSLAWQGMALRSLALSRNGVRIESFLAGRLDEAAWVLLENEIYAAVVGAVALLDNYAFSAWMVMDRLRVAGFNPRSEDPRDVSFAALTRRSPSPGIKQAVRSVIASSEYDDLRVLRNCLNHRSTYAEGFGLSGNVVTMNDSTREVSLRIHVGIVSQLVETPLKWAKSLVEATRADVDDALGPYDDTKIISTGKLRWS